MIGTLMRIGWTNLRRDRVAQSLTFLLPIVFFSIFAMVFGSQRNPTQKIRVAVVDEDQSEYSKKLVDALKAEGPLRVQTTTGDTETGVLLDPAAAERLIKDGALSSPWSSPKVSARPRASGVMRRHRAESPILADVSGSDCSTDGHGPAAGGEFHRDAGVDGRRGHVVVREAWRPHASPVNPPIAGCRR
jgi:hypothetical protein